MDFLLSKEDEEELVEFDVVEDVDELGVILLGKSVLDDKSIIPLNLLRFFCYGFYLSLKKIMSQNLI
jgi:hypothetical protein